MPSTTATIAELQQLHPNQCPEIDLGPYRAMFDCDTVRIVKAMKTMFLMLGWKKRSEAVWKNQDGEWVEFDYLKEQVVASGDTAEALQASAEHYASLLKPEPQDGTD